MKTRSVLSAASVIIILAFSGLPMAECHVQCYVCTMTPPSVYSNESRRLCSEFDYSEKFIVDCPYSTLCMKKDFTVYLPQPINGTIRDCATQKYETQKYENGQWRPEIKIDEPYEEGCSKVDDKGQRFSTTQFCYCKGDLCNSGDRTTIMPCFLILLAVIHVKLYFST